MTTQTPNFDAKEAARRTVLHIEHAGYALDNRQRDCLRQYIAYALQDAYNKGVHVGEARPTSDELMGNARVMAFDPSSRLSVKDLLERQRDEYRNSGSRRAEEVGTS